MWIRGEGHFDFSWRPLLLQLWETAVDLADLEERLLASVNYALLAKTFPR
jgi:hypothetical protein